MENHIISRSFVVYCFAVSMTHNATVDILVYEYLCADMFQLKLRSKGGLKRQRIFAIQMQKTKTKRLVEIRTNNANEKFI